MRATTALTRTFAYPALFALIAAFAMPQAALAEGAQKADSMQKAESAQKSGPGETLKLTRKEADDWQLRPVYTEDGEQVGELAAVTLETDGSIKNIRVSKDGKADAEGAVTVPADQFEIKGQRISLEVSQSEFKDMASTSG